MFLSSFRILLSQKYYVMITSRLRHHCSGKCLLNSESTTLIIVYIYRSLLAIPSTSIGLCLQLTYFKRSKRSKFNLVALQRNTEHYTETVTLQKRSKLHYLSTACNEHAPEPQKKDRCKHARQHESECFSFVSTLIAAHL
jgi:hypothetical protein